MPGVSRTTVILTISILQTELIIPESLSASVNTEFEPLSFGLMSVLLLGKLHIGLKRVILL